jgi:hypothetical protein
LARSVVTGDRIAIALGPDVASASPLLERIVGIFESASVRRKDIEIVTPRQVLATQGFDIPRETRLIEHDPDDRNRLAYLASDSLGRRIYLNRSVVDADLVLPVGRIGYQPEGRISGPWTALFPGLSDRPTQDDCLRDASGSSGLSLERLTLGESGEVCWLLGILSQVAVLDGAEGPAGIFIGSAEAIERSGGQLLHSGWSHLAPEGIDLVVAGIGRSERPTRLDEVTAALETASRAVSRGGIVLGLTDFSEAPGPALECLAQATDPAEALRMLQRLEGAPDHSAAKRLAQALERARVYLLSGWPRDFVDELGAVALSDLDEARRVIAQARRIVFCNRAEATRVDWPRRGGEPGKGPLARRSR